MSLLPKVILGRNVNRLRQLRCLTQEQLAEKVAVDRTYIQRIEKGTANPGIDVLHRLRDVLKVSWEELLEKM